MGVAVDGSGNIYVADETNGEIKEILAVNGRIPRHPTINILGSGSVSQGESPWTRRKRLLWSD